MGTGAGDYPARFGLAFDKSTRRPAPGTLVGGSPLRVFRLSGTGSRLLDSWLAGSPVGPLPAAQRLARRLVDAGVAQPRPPEGAGPGPDDVTVVVPVRDRPDGLAETLAALGDLKVVVVDDASIEPLPTGGAEVLRRAVAGGPGAARNTGWRCAGTPFVVFLDADCVPEPGWLARLLTHFADPHVAAVAPRVRSASGSGPLARYDTAMSPLDMGPDEAAVRPATGLPYVPTACLAIRRSALEDSGGFDESLRFGEDVDLVWRLVESGWMVRYEPRAEVSHPPRPDFRSMARQRFDYGRSAAPLAARHGRDVAPLALSPWSAAVWALVMVGRSGSAAALAAATSAALAARVSPDAPTTKVLASLALKGNLTAPRSLATAARRAWTPPLALAVCCAPRRVSRRAAAWLALAFVWPLAEWAVPAGGRERPRMGPVTWTVFRWMDDLAYQCGLWTGALEQRSAAALLPRWSARASGRAVRQAAATASSSASPVSR